MVRPVVCAAASAAIVTAIVVTGIMPRPVIAAVVVAAAAAVAAFTTFAAILGERQASRCGGECSQCKQAKRQPACKIFHDHFLR